jgi:hypothetical protein
VFKAILQRVPQLLLQEVFDVMSQPVAGSMHDEVNAGEDKGKAPVRIEPMEKVIRPGTVIDGPASSKQGGLEVAVARCRIATIVK